MNTSQTGSFDPEIVWHVSSPQLLAGDYRGVDAVFGYLGRLEDQDALEHGRQPMIRPLQGDARRQCDVG